MNILRRAIFDLQVQVLKFITSGSIDQVTIKEIKDAENLRSLPWKRRRQVVRNVRNALGLYAKLDAVMPELRARVNESGKTTTFTINLDGTITEEKEKQ